MPEFATVKTPEWPERPVTRIKAWNSGEWFDYLAESNCLRKHMPNESGRLEQARMVAWAVVDDKGEFVYKRTTVAEIEKAVEADTLKEVLASYYSLMNERAAVIHRVALAASKFHGLDGDTVFEIEKN